MKMRPSKAAGAEKEIKLSGLGAFGGMIVGAMFGLIGGTVGILIGGILGAIGGNAFEYQDLKNHQRDSELTR